MLCTLFLFPNALNPTTKRKRWHEKSGIDSRDVTDGLKKSRCDGAISQRQQPTSLSRFPDFFVTFRILSTISLAINRIRIKWPKKSWWRRTQALAPYERKERCQSIAVHDHQGIIHGILNALWKICSLVVNGQSFLVIDGYLLNLFQFSRNKQITVKCSRTGNE